MMKLYDNPVSGNCYKVRLLLTQLVIPFETVTVDISHGAERPSEFLATTPIGKVPVLQVSDDTYLAESNAILCYLAEDTLLLPGDRVYQARIHQWLFFEQNLHEPFIATSRYWRHVADRPGEVQNQIEFWAMRGKQALEVMDRHLTTHDFFACDRYTIADIALYAYTHVADEGGFDLAPYSAIHAWFDRVRAQPNHVPIS